jgi:hypothetical protein
MAFWPLSDLTQIPNSTPTTGWRNEIGGNFWAWLNHTGSRWALMAEAAILRFQFPAPPCLAVVCWGTKAKVEMPTPPTLAAQFAWIDSDWLVHEARIGEGFSPSVFGYTRLTDGLRVDSDGANTTQNTTDLDGCFDVLPGVRPRVHIGVSLMLIADNGRVSTIDVGGLGDHFRFENGVTFVMAGY